MVLSRAPESSRAGFPVQSPRTPSVAVADTQGRAVPWRDGDVPVAAGLVARDDAHRLVDREGMTYLGPVLVLDGDGRPVRVFRPDYPPGAAPWLRHPGCGVCLAMRDPVMRYGPAHEVRDQCPSGRSHCSCPVCFG